MVLCCLGYVRILHSKKPAFHRHHFTSTPQPQTRTAPFQQVAPIVTQKGACTNTQPETPVRTAGSARAKPYAPRPHPDTCAGRALYTPVPNLCLNFHLKPAHHLTATHTMFPDSFAPPTGPQSAQAAGVGTPCPLHRAAITRYACATQAGCATYYCGVS